MAQGTKTKGRKGKLGKNKARIAVYYNSGNYEWNRMRRLVHHMREHANDSCALARFKTLKAALSLHRTRAFADVYGDVP